VAPIVSDGQFVADGTIGILGSEKQAGKQGAVDTHQGCLIKVIILQG